MKRHVDLFKIKARALCITLLSTTRTHARAHTQLVSGVSVERVWVVPQPTVGERGENDENQRNADEEGDEYGKFVPRAFTEVVVVFTVVAVQIRSFCTRRGGSSPHRLFLFSRGQFFFIFFFLSRRQRLSIFHHLARDG